MKKTLSTIGIFLLCMGTTVASYGAATNNGKGGTLTVTDATATTLTGGPGLTFNSSPNVSIVSFTTKTAYAIETTNILTDTTNGMEYYTLSSATGYWQKEKTTAVDTALSALTSATAAPTGTWTAIGGS
jgi:hypothetical protein